MSDHPDAHHGPEIPLTLAFVFLLVVAGGVVDLILDRPTTLLSVHVAFEVSMVAVSLVAAAYLARGWYRAQARLDESERETERQRRARADWEERASAVLRGLGSEIDDQLDRWSLTPAEKRVALMLLQGASHKRIARVTGTSERTVRQHSVAAYRKAGLAGRAELAGFFLGSLLPSDEPREQVGDARAQALSPSVANT